MVLLVCLLLYFWLWNRKGFFKVNCEGWKWEKKIVFKCVFICDGVNSKIFEYEWFLIIFICSLMGCFKFKLILYMWID